MDNYEEAFLDFKTAANLNPTYSVALFEKGRAAIKIEKNEEAFKAFNKFIELNSNDSTAWYYKGLTLKNLMKNTEAFEVFNTSLILNPNQDKIYRSLSEHSFKIGDLDIASKEIEKAVSINENSYSAWKLKGRIKIEEQDYDSAILCFKKAISLCSVDPLALLWEAYAKYLKAEVSFGSSNKRYQEMILSTIRELEKIDTYVSPINETIPFVIIVKKLIWQIFLLPTRALLLMYGGTNKYTIKLLGKINKNLKQYRDLKVNSYSYYFLGCFYYKINDFFTSITYLKKCLLFSSDYSLSKSASQLIENMWNHQIRPSFWKWWLSSPIKSFIRKFVFILIFFCLFIVLMSHIISKFFSPISYLDELLMSINWIGNSTQNTLIIMILLFILISPCIQRIKGSDIEIEISLPPLLELSPGIIEKNLKELDDNYRDIYINTLYGYSWMDSLKIIDLEFILNANSSVNSSLVNIREIILFELATCLNKLLFYSRRRLKRTKNWFKNKV